MIAIKKAITVGIASTVLGIFPYPVHGETVPQKDLKDLVSFRLEKQDAGYVMVSPDVTLKNEQEGDALPYGFILPDIYSNRADLIYVFKCHIEPNWNSGNDNLRHAIFAFGLNISGGLPNSASLAFLNSNHLISRITSSDVNEIAQIDTEAKVVKGKVYAVELRIDGRKIELFYDGRRIGAASIGNGFTWVKNRPFYIGGERTGVSVFNGKITDCSLTILQHPVDTTLADRADYQELMKNPYNRTIIGAAEGILSSGSEYSENRIATEEDNWLYRDMANRLMTMSYAYTMPGSGYYKSPEVLGYLTRGISYLANAYGYTDWVNKKGGDPNINWFTLVPFVETLQRVANDLPEDVRTLALERIRGVLSRHYQEYGTKSTDVYPNIDAFYMLAMLHGSQLLNEKLFGDEYERVLNNLEACQYPDGGWPYYKTTNESIWYHEMVVGALARVYSLNQSPAALRMLEKSIPYYKLSVGPIGVPEYVTDPFWKHNWGDLPARGPSIVAGVTGDGNNKWIADRANMSGGNVMDFFAALFWKDMKAEPMPTNYVVLDRNVNGPRGFFKNWSWAASASYGCDTLVGCFAKDPGSNDLKGLLAVKAQIDDPKNALGMPPSGNHGNTVITENSAVFSSEYKMGGFKSVWGQPLYHYDWTCRQQWSLDSKSMTGEIVITSGADQKSPPPVVRFLFGKNGEMEKVSPERFEYSPYSLLIEHSDFSETSIHNVPACPLIPNKLNGRELVFSIPTRTDYKKGESFVLKVTLKKN
jgi:hypothetical protein